MVDTHRVNPKCDCDDGYYEANKIACDECLTDCKVCANGNTCTTCYGNLTYTGGVCGCKDNTYKNGQNCEYCIDNCLKCVDGKSC